MVKLYLSSFSRFLVIITFLVTAGALHAFSTEKLSLPRDTTKVQQVPKTKITDTRKDKPQVLKNGLKVTIEPFKPAPIKINTAPKAGKKSDNGKLLSNVKVYPNPVASEINVSYHLNKEVNVTIKIMDFLGNEITTLLSQKIPSGNQDHTFNISSKLNSGLYFIRFIAGNETIVKRISVL
jgi:hypothetical protein